MAVSADNEAADLTARARLYVIAVKRYARACRLNVITIRNACVRENICLVENRIHERMCAARGGIEGVYI